MAGTQAAAPADGELASASQMAKWLERFRAYRQPPDAASLEAWLGRFERRHLPLAHKILDAVIVVSELEIHQGYKSSLENLEGWSKSSQERVGRWFFVGVGSAGESGPAMLRMFREANGLTSERWQGYFVTTKDLPRLALSALDNVVFIDDFAGSGSQMVGYWPVMEELVASEATCYLLLTAVTTTAAEAISSQTELNLVAPIVLGHDKNVFHEACRDFSEEDCAAIEAYGQIAWRSWPRGFQHCGLTLVLSHKTPNNSLPILHANHAAWVGPFPRTLIAA